MCAVPVSISQDILGFLYLRISQDMVGLWLCYSLSPLVLKYSRVLRYSGL